MPSYLGYYPTAARDRKRKILRAIESVLQQTYKSIELVIVADGCDETMLLVKNKYKGNAIIKGYYLDYENKKRKMFAGHARNTGISKATGEWICYLDIDDCLREDHVQNIVKSIQDKDWLWFDDYRWNKKEEKFYQNKGQLILGHCGISNIAHKRNIQARFNEDNKYGFDDWHFIRQLKNNPNYSKMFGAGYYVCHIPGAKGYDI